MFIVDNCLFCTGSVRVKYSTSEGDKFYKDLNILGSAGIAVQSGIVLTKEQKASL